MTSGSIGSHRAFMGVCITLCVCLILTLFVGWKWYSDTTTGRGTLISMAKKAEEKARELENMGLSIDAAGSKRVPTPAMPGMSIQEMTPETSVETTADLFPPASSIKELPLLENGEDVSQALVLLDQYWNTESWKDRVPMVHSSERVAPLMQDYYEKQKASDPMPGGLVSKARYLINGVEILYFSYTSSRPTGTLEVAMLRDTQGKFLIDWESLNGYSYMSFHDFRDQRPDKPVTMRAYVRSFEYYNFEFADASKYLCIKLTSESGDSSIYAYCDRGTALARWLETDLASTGPNGFKGYTMLLSFPSSAQSNNCVRLEKVLAARWLMPK